jgi:hypothetical protein
LFQSFLFLLYLFSIQIRWIGHFLIKSPQREQSALHFNCVVPLLNHLFGIQTRGGSCTCVIPYLTQLLASKDLEPIFKDCKSIAFDSSVKPEWAKLGFSHSMSEETVDYIAKAVDLVPNEGHRRGGMSPTMKPQLDLLWH